MFNKEKIKKHIIKAIAIMPTTVILKRTPNVSDGMNGTVKGTEFTVATFDGLLDDGGAKRSTGNTQSASDGGNTENISGITVMCPSVDKDGVTYKILFGDYFTVNEVLYKVIQPNLIYGIYWLCTLEVAV